MSDLQPLRVALLDLNNGHPNQGMRCLRDMLVRYSRSFGGVPFVWDEFDVRQRAEVPNLSYDIYLSSGGPGSPFEGEGTAWEAAYFTWMDRVLEHNAKGVNSPKRVLFICHSFEMMVRHLDLAELTERKKPTFGIYPIYKTPAGHQDPILEDLPDPFYGADFRSWQAVQPNRRKIRNIGATLLALENLRPHIAMERALMGIRLSPDVVGLQFHPEADPPGMLAHFSTPERRNAIVDAYGEARFERLITRIHNPHFLARTHNAVLPGFLRRSVERLRPEARRQAA